MSRRSETDSPRVLELSSGPRIQSFHRAMSGRRLARSATAEVQRGRGSGHPGMSSPIAMESVEHPCPECGADNPETNRYCGSCGAALAAPAIERRKLATLVFCDVAGSTALGDRTDPEAVRELMLSYFTVAREVLERH